MVVSKCINLQIERFEDYDLVWFAVAIAVGRCVVPLIALFMIIPPEKGNVIVTLK